MRVLHTVHALAHPFVLHTSGISPSERPSPTFLVPAFAHCIPTEPASSRHTLEPARESHRARTHHAELTHGWFLSSPVQQTRRGVYIPRFTEACPVSSWRALVTPIRHAPTPHPLQSLALRPPSIRPTLFTTGPASPPAQRPPPQRAAQATSSLSRPHILVGWVVRDDESTRAPSIPATNAYLVPSPLSTTQPSSTRGRDSSTVTHETPVLVCVSCMHAAHLQSLQSVTCYQISAEGLCASRAHAA